MKIVCYGDSNTYGYDSRSYFGERYSSEERWVDILAKRTGWQFVNDGVNGREVPMKSEEFPLDMDLLIVMLGTNDLFQGKRPLEIANKMKRFLQSISAKNILLISPPVLQLGEWVSGDELIQNSKELLRLYSDIARQCEIMHADAEEWGVELLYDGVHFSEVGHRAFANGLYQYLTNCKFKVV